MSSVTIASSLDKATLERLERYLSHHGVACRFQPSGAGGGRWALVVDEAVSEKARRVLSDIALAESSGDHADEVIEIRLEEAEATEISAWLELLLEQQDHEGTPVYFYRSHYESILDALREDGRLEVPAFLLKALASFIPQGAGKLVMGVHLQEFFRLIEAVAASEEP